MYLSKYSLDLSSPSVRNALVNCCDMHRNIQRLFDTDRSEADVLYRVHKSKNETSVYVSSSVMPKNKINGMRLIGSKNMNGFIDKINSDDVLGFNLLTMPCKKTEISGVKNSRRVFLKNPDDRLIWLEKKAHSNGFDILTESVTESAEQNVYGIKSGNKIIFSAVCFNGYIRVFDKNVFIKALETGIGPEKAYGLGMILLSR